MGARTLAGSVGLGGVGLHSGARCEVVLQPGESGIRFLSRSEPAAPPIPAHVSAVADTRLATTLGKAGWTVQTVEHLLSAAVGLGVDHLDVVVDGPELPILDGTAGPWAEAMREAGLQDSEVPRSVLVVDRTVRIEEDQSWLEARPSGGLSLDLTIDFDHPLIGVQHLVWDLAEGAFEAELGWARTFGFERDVLALQRMGLIAGGSLDNALVFSESELLNPEGLRKPDEPVRHKAMDLLGDLALLGHPVRGHFVGHRPGHGRVIALLRALLEESGAWHIERCDAP